MRLLKLRRGVRAIESVREGFLARVAERRHLPDANLANLLGARGSTLGTLGTLLARALLGLGLLLLLLLLRLLLGRGGGLWGRDAGRLLERGELRLERLERRDALLDGGVGVGGAGSLERANLVASLRHSSLRRLELVRGGRVGRPEVRERGERGAGGRGQGTRRSANRRLGV